MTDLFEFNEEKHEYRLNGKKLPSVTEVCSMINGDKFAINESVLRQAQQRGTAVHELTAMFDNEIADLEIDPEIEGYFRAWQSFCRDYQPEWLFVERMVYSQEMSVAGTIDRLGIIDDIPVIVDIKTTASMDRTSIASLLLQLSGYWAILNVMEEKYDLTNSMGVQLMKDGSYKVYRYSEYLEKYYNADLVNMFLCLLTILNTVRGNGIVKGINGNK